jgi:hypothetical protein
VRRGEEISAGINGSARGLAKLGTFLANKGTCNENTLMTTNAWEKLHSDPEVEQDKYFRTNFTIGGLNQFGIEHLETPEARAKIMISYWLDDGASEL